MKQLKLPRSKTGRGFTLIELMVCLVILSLILGITTLSFAQFDRRSLEEEIALSYQLLKSTRNWSQLKNTPYLIEVEEMELLVSIWSEEEWQLVQTLALSFSPMIDVYRIGATSFTGNREGLLFLPNGLYTSFNYRTENSPTQISGDGESDIEMFSGTQSALAAR